MMYLFDKELRLIDIIGRDNIISFNYEREKNGLYFIEAVLPLSKTNKDGYVNLHAKLNKATYVGHYDKDGRFQMHRTIVLEIEKDEIFLRGVHLFFDEAKAFGVVNTRVFKDSEVAQVAPYLFSPLGWKLHSSDPSPARTITFDDISVLEARKMLVEVYGFEFDYWFDFDGQKITDKWYTIKRQIGKETYKRYRYGSNALNVKAEEDYSEVYTAVIGKGALLEPIERAAAQKKYEADKKRVEAEQKRIKDEHAKAKAAHAADRKATLKQYEAAVADWRKKRDAITAQRKARTKRKRVKGKKLPKLPRLVTPPKPKYPKAKPAPKQAKLPKLPKRPEDAKAPSKDEHKDERRVEFTNVIWKKPTNPLDKPKGQRVLVDPVTTDLFGYRDEAGKRVPKTAVVVFDDVADPSKVLSLSYNWLKENNRPKAIFSVEVADDEPLDLGDTVHIIYKEANQVASSRVFKVRDNLIADTRSVEFGDGEHFTKDGKVEKIGKDVQSLRRRVKDEIYARKVEFDTEFDRQVHFIQEAYDEALADALVEVDALAEAITTEIDTAQEDFIDDIEAAITLAEVEAEERAEELEGMLIDELAEQKSSLQEEIKQSYDKAVVVATEKAEEKGREIDDIIRKESESLKSDIQQTKQSAESATKAAVEKVTSELTKQIEDGVGEAKGIVEALSKDYVKQSEVSVQDDGIFIGSKKIGGDSLASAIAVTPGNVDIITKAMRVTGDMNVAGDIKSLSLAAVNADIANLRTKIVTANSIDAAKIKVDAALIDKLDTSEILSKKIIASKAFLDEVKSKSIEATRGDIAWLRSNVITADSIDATALKVDTALADKLFATNILTTKLVADSTYSKSVKTLALEAARADIGWLKTNVLTANSIGTAALQANSVSADKLKVDTAFVSKLMADKALVDSLKAKSMEAVNANIGTLRTSILSANVVKASNITSDNALIDKIFANEALVKRLTSKQAFIRDIKAIDIEAVRMRAVDRRATVNIEGGSITMNRSDNAKLNIGINGIEMYNQYGTKSFSLDPGLVTSSALGTSVSNVYLACQRNSEARVIDIDDVGNDGDVSSYRYKPIRALALKFGAGANGYIGIDGAELRVMADRLLEAGGYKDVRAAGFFGNTLDVNTYANGTHLYLRPASGGEVKVTYSGTSDKYASIRSNGIYAPYIDYNGKVAGGHLYVRPSSGNEVRFTMTGTTDKWANIRFGNWNAMSHEKFKHDIEKWDYNVLDLYRHELELHRYKVNHETNRMYHHGIILRENSKDDKFPVEWRNGDGYDGTEVLWWNTKAVQELAFENDALKRWVQDEMSQLSTSLRELKQQNESLRKEVEQLKTETLKGGV